MYQSYIRTKIQRLDFVSPGVEERPDNAVPKHRSNRYDLGISLAQEVLGSVG